MNTRTRLSRKGAALMMVVVILALLLVLAVSFTFLMTQQEGTSVASLGGEQTRVITRTGADHAYARLTPRNRLNEFERWYATLPSDVTHDDNPFVDWEGEWTVDLLADFEGWGDQEPLFPGLLDGEGNPLFRVEDPRRRVLGLNVVDESGKVNLNGASVGLIGNLIGSSWITTNANSAGMVYEELVLQDASFLDPYDQRRGDGRTRGGGYVVIDNQLFSYTSRRGNVLYNCVPNPIYNGVDGTNALFSWRSPGREIQSGEYVTTPTAYKIAYRLWLQSDGRTPVYYNSIGDVRRIAELDRWFTPNVAFGPDVMGARMDGWPEGLDPVTNQWLEENATAVAPTQRFDHGWFYPHVVTWGEMTPVGESGLFSFTLRYDDQVAVEPGMYVRFDPRRPGGNGIATRGGIGQGNLVRLRRLDDDTTVLGWVLSSGRGQMRVCVRGQHQVGPNNAWVVEVAERASININSANFDTLAALFHGVGPRGQSAGNQPIGREDAETIASRILERTRDGFPDNEFQDLDELLAFLTRLSQETPPPINAQQIGIFAQMQRYPYANIPGIVTAQVRFDSLDSFMVDAFATRYQPSGGAMARHAFREWVQIGSDADKTWRWRTRRMLEDEMRVPQGNVMQLHPAGVENQRTMGLIELPYLRYPQTERLARPWRAQPWSEPTSRNVYNLAQDGNGVLEKFYSSIVDTNLNVPQGTGEYGDLEAGMFNFWYRPHWAGLDSNHYLFDVAEQEFSNRMSLLWWGDRRGAYNMSGRNSGLTYRIKDRTLEEAFVELRYEMDEATWREREWYHMGLNWKGTELSHLNLLLDGDSEATGGGQSIKPVVNHTFRDPVSRAWVNRTSTLQEDLEDPRVQAMTQFELRIDPDDIDAFPDRGVVVIGDEAIEYNGKTAFALVGINRGPPVIDPMTGTPIPDTAGGARGTTASYHPRGSRVTVFGYTAPIRRYQNANNPNQTWRPRFPHLPETRGRLDTAMGTDAFKRVSKEGTNNSDYYRPTELGPDAGFPGAGDAARGGDPNHLPLNDYSGMPQQGVVAVMGLAWIDYFDPGTQGIPESGVSYPNWQDDGDSNTPPVPPAVYPPPLMPRFEYVAYDGIDANRGLSVVARYDENFNRKAPNTWWHFLGGYDVDLFPAQPNNEPYTNRVNFWALGSVVMLVSIDASDITGYHNRSIVQINREWFFYNHVWNPLDPNIDINGATPGGADDHMFPALLYIDAGRMQANVQLAAATDNRQPTPWAPWRGAMGTTVTAHMASAPITPTFGTTVTTGERDIVTVVDGKNNNKVQRLIRVQRNLRAYAIQFNVGWQPNDQEYICALDDHVGMDYMPNQGNNPYNQGNLCKFPTGELPVELPTSWTFAGPDPRTLDAGSQGEGLVHTGDFDSFEFRMFSKGNFRILTDMTASQPSEGGSIRVNTNLPPNMGVVRIDEELVAYRGFEIRQTQVTDPQTGQTFTIDTYWLIDITRGILGTDITAHAGGTPIMNMASMRVGRPVTAGSPRQNEIRTILGEDTFRPYGFVRIEDQDEVEIAGYQKYEEIQQEDPDNPGMTIRYGDLTCGLLNHPNHPQGLFRGAYGTRALNYSERALFFDQPVRFPDWFPNYHEVEPLNFGPWHNETRPEWGIPGASSPEISHFQGAATFRNSLFKEFKWRIQYAPLADMSRHLDAIGARLVVRFKERGSPMPEWDSIPTNEPGGLWSFEFNPNGLNTEDLGTTLYEQTEDFTQGGFLPGVRAARIEWRVYFYFKRDAFINEDYKTTLQFQGAETTLTQLTRVVRHENKR